MYLQSYLNEDTFHFIDSFFIILSIFKIYMHTGRAGPLADRAGPGWAFKGPRAERAENGPKYYTERIKVYYVKPKKFLKLT